MKNLELEYDKLQLKYGAKDVCSVYGYGCNNNPRLALVFMNPTKKNIATDPNWKGIRAQWLGTKPIWNFLEKCGLFSSKLNQEIKDKKPKDWTPSFCEKVYEEVEKKKLWITNLAKCTQDDARPLKDEIFLAYKELLKKELNKIKPKTIIFFGNQVSSIMLEEEISVSNVRLKEYDLSIDDCDFEAYAVFYPVGNGRFNQPKAIEDIRIILEKGEN